MVRPRRLIVLTSHPTLHTPRRLVEAGRALGVDVELRSPRPGRRPPPASSCHGAVLLARPGTFSFVASMKEHRRLTAVGAIALQPRRVLLDACDQWRTLLRARAAGLAIPPTELVRRPDELAAALRRVPGPPWFLKARRGSQGSQVLLAATREEALRAGHLFWGTGASFLLQQDLRARGRVERHFVVGGELLASAIAHPSPREYRSNAHRGGRFEVFATGASAGARLAVLACAALRVPFAAVDTIGEREPALLEVNASPGIESLERATGRDLARPLLAALFGTAADDAVDDGVGTAGGAPGEARLVD